MEILENRPSLCFTEYCEQPEDGYGMYMVTKDMKIEQECQHIYYNFYLTPELIFPPLLGFQWVRDHRLLTPPHANILQALSLENSMDNIGALGLLVEDNLFN
jgi:hypothetical protein